jgi:DNA-binding transcriptional ArsR family regulator
MESVSEAEQGGPAAAAETETMAGGNEARQVTDVETLKVLADPTRLSILTALMGWGREHLRVMSVKELAAELDEPQTKLYRHVKQLEAVGLIRVAASRLVSGILEQRYQACQSDLMFGPGLLGDTAAADEAEPAIVTLLDRYRRQFFAARRAGLIEPGDYPPEQAYRRSMLVLAETRVSASRAAAIRLKLDEVMDELNAPGAEDPDGVPVNVLIGFYSADLDPGAA